jgi:hypothetical protein
MSIPTTEPCPGSLTCAVQLAVTNAVLSPQAVCSVCHATLELGYGGRVPVHERVVPGGSSTQDD